MKRIRALWRPDDGDVTIDPSELEAALKSDAEQGGVRMNELFRTEGLEPSTVTAHGQS